MRRPGDDTSGWSGKGIRSRRGSQPGTKACGIPFSIPPAEPGNEAGTPFGVRSLIRAVRWCRRQGSSTTGYRSCDPFGIQNSPRMAPEQQGRKVIARLPNRNCHQFRYPTDAREMCIKTRACGPRLSDVALRALRKRHADKNRSSNGASESTPPPLSHQRGHGLHRRCGSWGG